MKNFIRQYKASAIVALCLMCFAVMCAVAVVSSTAQTSTDEKTLKDEIPKHLPIKVKVKNWQSKKWLDELEVEVTNTSDKPIYYLRLGFILLDVKFEGSSNNIVFPLRYGRGALVDFSTPLQPDDVPIQPGATHIFRPHPSNTRGFEKYSKKKGLPESKKFELIFGNINYGDGTGFNTTSGLPIPNPDVLKKRSANDSCGKEDQAQRATTGFAEVALLSISLFRFAPASFAFAPMKENASALVKKGFTLPTTTQRECCPVAVGR